MGFMDELRKLTQPYDDEDDFFDGADSSQQQAQPSQAQIEFENTFGDEQAPPPEPAARQQKASRSGGEGGLLGGIIGRRNSKPAKPQREQTVNFGGSDMQVILFNPKSFDEAGELVGHLAQRRSLVMTLEGVPTEMARRLLDFLSGITFAMQGKITPISAKTYFVTPQNVDIKSAQGDQPESDGQYL